MRSTICCFMVLFLLGCSATHQNQLNQNPTKNVSYKNQQISKDLTQTDYSKLQNNDKENTITEKSHGIENKERSVPKKQKVILDVPIIRQNPELKYGCEVTSLAMLLQYAGVRVGKMELARIIAKDNDPVVKDKNGNILKWGNPNHGFVGDVTGRQMGFAVFVKPTENLMNRYLPGRTVNLTQKPFDQLLDQVRKGRPVLTWVTGDFKAPDQWESWRHGSETINTSIDLHAVVLVGFDKNFVYVNDPLTGRKAAKVDMSSFKTAWKGMGKQALSYN